MKHKSLLPLLFLSVASLSVVAASAFSYEAQYEPVVAYQNSNPEDYYSSIDFSLEGNAILKQLQDLNAKEREKTIPYTSLFTYFPETDKPENPSDVAAGKIVGFYSGTVATRSEMNREHTWPKSHGGNLVENDIHVIRPTLTKENSDRGNSFYVEGMDSDALGWDPANCGDETYRGDAARIIFYCCVAEPQLSLVDLDIHSTSNNNPDKLMGKLSDLMEWNLKYPVTARERQRNEAAERIQGNRNPFIDHPELAVNIWKNYNADIQQICADYGYGEGPLPPVEEDSLKLNTNSLSLNVGETAQLEAIATGNVKTSEIVWMSADTNIATVDNNGLVTAVGSGEVNVSVFTVDYAFYDICRVKVIGGKEEPTSESKMKCGGNIVTTSASISIISIIGIAILLKRKKQNV